MQPIISRTHQALAWIILAALVLQFYLAGTALFGVGSFEPHRTLGTVIAVPVILLLVLALVGRLGRRLIGLSIVLTLITMAQMALPSLREDISWIAALHPVVGLALMGISSAIGRTGSTKTSRVNE